MADTNLVSRSGKGSTLTAADYDQNIEGLNSASETITSATHEILYTDHGKLIELDNATMVCTLDSVSDIQTAMDSSVSDFRVTLKNINAAMASVIRSASDTIDDAATIYLRFNESVTLQTNAAADGWAIVGNRDSTTSAEGDIIVGNTSGRPKKLTVGTAYQALRSDGTNPVWSEWYGCLAYLTSAQSLANDTNTQLVFDVASYNTPTIWSAVSPRRFTIPSNVTLVKITAGVVIEANATGRRLIKILKNGIPFVGGASSSVNAVSGGATRMSVTTAIVTTVATDYFECFVYQDSGVALDLSESESWMGMEVLA